MVKKIFKNILFSLLPLSIFSQNRQMDSTRIQNKFLIGINNSFQFANYKDFSDNDVVNNNQFEITLMPRFGYFFSNNLAIGFQWQYGWYWSNFGRTMPNPSSRGIFLEYYFTKWKSYKFNTIKRKNKIVGYLHPFINFSYNFKNYYNGLDSVNGIGAIFNGRTDNQSLRSQIGINWNTLRKINFNISLGIQTSTMPKTIINNTRLIKHLPISNIGITIYLNQRNKL